MLHMEIQASSLDVCGSCELSKSAPKRISTRRWKMIKCFHIIEPATMQLYIAMNLRVPHYQVPGTMSKQYLLCLQDFVSKNSDKEVIMYRNTVGFHRNNFVTVINDINFCPELKELSKHFNHTQAMYLIQKFKEHGKEDGNRNNVFFDRNT